MPYITSEERESLDHSIETLAAYILAEGGYEGRLNYSISKLLTLIVSDKGKRYQTLNALMGVLESAKQEFYRKSVAPYEDEKIEENGDLEW